MLDFLTNDNSRSVNKILKEWARENMVKWKSPKYIEFVRKLPVSMTGKVQRRELQEKDKEKLKEGKAIKG